MKTKTGTQKKTILYVDHTACLGGGEIALLNLLCALDKVQYLPIVVLGSDGPFADKLRAQSIQVLIEPLDDAVLDTRKDTLGLKSLLNLRRLWMSLRYSLRIASIAKQYHANLIHTNSLKADIFGGIAGRICGIPVIWHIRDNIAAPYLPQKAAAFFRFLAKFVPTHVVTNSKSTLRTLHFSTAPGPASQTVLKADAQAALEQKTWHVVYCGCAAEQFIFEDTSPRDNGPITLIGRIAEWKGQHIFIQAAAKVLDRFPDAKFQIVGAPLFGEEEYEQRLHEMVRSMHLEGKVAFLGFRNDIPQILRKSGIVVHASTIGEPFGQVVVEAMASGRPVIATQGGALPEIIIDGETGMLVPMGDPVAMGDAVCDLLANPARAELMGAAGRRRVQDHFTITHAVSRVEAIYASIFDRNRAVVPEPQSAV